MKTNITILTLALAASLPAFAGSSAKATAPVAPKEEVRRAIVYDFVEVGYNSVLSHQAGDFYGGYLNVSYSPINNVYVFARGSAFGGDDTAFDLSVGAGVYLPMTANADLVLEAGYNYFDFDDSSVNSVFVSPGFRAMVTSKLELNANATFTFADEGDNSIAVGGGFVYYVTSKVGITGGYYYDLDDESHFYSAGVRYLW